MVDGPFLLEASLTLQEGMSDQGSTLLCLGIHEDVAATRVVKRTAARTALKGRYIPNYLLNQNSSLLTTAVTIRQSRLSARSSLKSSTLISLFVIPFVNALHPNKAIHDYDYRFRRPARSYVKSSVICYFDERDVH